MGVLSLLNLVPDPLNQKKKKKIHLLELKS